MNLSYDSDLKVSFLRPTILIAKWLGEKDVEAKIHDSYDEEEIREVTSVQAFAFPQGLSARPEGLGESSTRPRVRPMTTNGSTI